MKSWRMACLLAVLLLYGAPELAAAVAEHAAGHSAAGEHGEAAHGPPNPMTIDPDLSIFTAIVFLVLLAILWKFAWGPIVAALEEREKGIADNIAAAHREHEKAKQMRAEFELQLAGAADRVRELLDEARRDAEHTKAEILAEAKAAAQAEHERAMREVRNAKEAALKEIGEASANFAVDLAARIIEKELNPADHSRLIREAMVKFPMAGPSVN